METKLSEYKNIWAPNVNECYWVYFDTNNFLYLDVSIIEITNN